MGLGHVPLRSLGVRSVLRLGLGAGHRMGRLLGLLARRGRILRLGAAPARRGVWAGRRHRLPQWSCSGRFFVFVDLGHFSDPIHRRDVIVNNTVIINRTVNITGSRRVNNVVVNHGPRVDEIQKYSARRLTEAPPRAALDRGATARSRGTLPEVVRPNANRPVREPVKAEKANKGEPQVIRGGTGQGVYENKQPGKQGTAPLPTVYKPTVEKPERPMKGSSQNFGTRGSSPYSPAAPDSIQPRQRTSHELAPKSQPSRGERATEKRGQPSPEQGREESPKKGQSGGN